MNPAGLNEGNSPIASGGFLGPALYSDGLLCSLTLNDDGTLVGLDTAGAPITGKWSTDHNGLNQAAACIFVKALKNVSGVPTLLASRMNFPATPIIATDDGRGNYITYSMDVIRKILIPAMTPVPRNLSIFQLYNQPDQ